MRAAFCRFVFVFTVMAATDSVQTSSTISLQVWFALLHDVTLPKSCPMTEQAVYSTVFLLICAI